MRKALLPMVACLALCGAATVALVATNARAEQSPKKPVMLAMTTDANADLDAIDAPPEGGDMGDMGPGPMGAGGMKRMCKDMVARQTGELAYLEAKLALTPTQAPLYARWKGVMLDTAAKHQAACMAMPARKAGEKSDVMRGMAMEEKLLHARLADLEAEKPALSALYASLTPEQQMDLGRAARHKMEGRMHMMMGMMDHRGGRMGMMGHPPMGRGPDGPGAPPPPPPAQ